MSAVILPMLLYILEITKYGIGHKLFFGGKIKGIKPIILSGVIYLTVIILGNFPFENRYLISYVAAGISVYFIFAGKWKVKVFRMLSILTVTSSLDELIGIILSFSFDNLVISEIEAIIESMITIIIFLLIIAAKNKYILLDTKENNLYEIKRSIIIVILVMNLGLATGALLYVQKYIIDEKIKTGCHIISFLTYGCIIIVVIYILSMKSANERMGKVIETERALKQMSENYYSALLRKEEETRRYRHDMNDHILCLKEYARKEKATNTLQYIEILQEKLDEIQKRVYFTGNEILDILLNYHFQFLNHTDIAVTGVCKSKLEINDVDFCIIMSNLLQNAVEEIFRLENKNRYIRIKVEQGKSFFRLEVRNSSKAVFTTDRKMPETQKEDKDNHGIGLMNIMETIERNQGKFELEGNGKEVRATIILPLETTVQKVN